MVVVPIDGADDLDKVELHELAHQVVDECLLACLDVLVTHRVDQVVECRTRGEDAGGVLCAGSNFSGTGAQTASCSVTESIISPPVSMGGMALSRSILPHSTPMPMGPIALCALKAKKSAPRSATSTGMCGSDCAPSTTR